jgi:hypothetical protein
MNVSRVWGIKHAAPTELWKEFQNIYLQTCRTYGAYVDPSHVGVVCF